MAQPWILTMLDIECELAQVFSNYCSCAPT